MIFKESLLKDLIFYFFRSEEKNHIHFQIENLTFKYALIKR